MSKEKNKVVFCEDGSINIYFRSPINKQSVDFFIMFGNIRDLRLIGVKNDIIGVKFLNKEAMRLCSEVNNFPRDINEVLALKNGGDD